MRIIIIPAFLLSILFHTSISLAGSSGRESEKLKSCDPYERKVAANKIIKDPATLNEPLELFPASWELYAQGMKDEAVFWFYVAQLRTRYQLVTKKGDVSQLLSIMMSVYGEPINNYAYQDIPKLIRTLNRVLDWDKKSPNPYRDIYQSESNQREIQFIYKQFNDYKIKLTDEQDSLEAKAREASPRISLMYQNVGICSKEKIASDTIEKEWPLVLDFVGKNQEVIKRNIEIQKLERVSTNVKNKEELPTQYQVSVIGVIGEEVFVFVDVTRQSKVSQFKLACIKAIADETKSCGL